VATLRRRLIRKCVAPILIFSVPKGCSAVSRRWRPDTQTYVGEWLFAPVPGAILFPKLRDKRTSLGISRFGSDWTQKRSYE
jgi:hypothetical protein